MLPRGLICPHRSTGLYLTSAKDISPPLVKSFAVNQMDFVYKMEVEEGGDFGGLFGRSDQSLSDTDGMTGNLLGISDLEDISNPSRTDMNFVSLKRTAQDLRHALMSATKSRNIPLMIDTYISGAELKFVKGDKSGPCSRGAKPATSFSTSSWSVHPSLWRAVPLCLIYVTSRSCSTA